MPINLDFSGVDTSGFQKPEEGDHVFVISDAIVEPNKAQDSQNLKVRAEVVGGDSDGRSVLSFFSFKEGALWNLKLFLEAIAGEELESVDIDEKDLVGKTFVGTVRHTDDGQYANIVAFEHNG